MQSRLFLFLVAVIVVSAPRQTAPLHLLAQDVPGVALTGRVTSSEEGPMEGVVISARRSGSTISHAVVSDEQGRYGFPASRLSPGDYTLKINAVGYDLASPGAVSIAADKTTTADLTLTKAKDTAAQLSNTDWLNSFPGTDEQRASVRGCGHCHTLERIAKSRFDPDAWLPVMERMSGYPPLSFPLMPQKRPADRIGGGATETGGEQRMAGRRRQAEYLASLNLSAQPTWAYPFKIQPRPKGSATRAIYTEYDLPAPTRQPHDVIVDSQGTVWYASFGEQILGKIDPRTGKATEFQIPTLKPGAPTGILGMRFDRDENPWLAMQFQGGIAKFDRTTEKFQTWSLPPEFNGDHVQINQISPDKSHVDGKVWFQDAGTYNIYRLDIASGKIEVFELYKVPRPNVYDVIPDSANNGWFTVLGAEEVGRIDAKTGEIKIFKTPTPRSGPRRGMMDSQDRLWIGLNRADKIAMFDTRTEKWQEWSVPTPGAWPYDVTADANGDVWAGGEYNDRILRLDPRTGQFIEYGLPHAVNVRRVWVQNSTKPVTFWVGSTHSASIIALQPVDSTTTQSLFP